MARTTKVTKKDIGPQTLKAWSYSRWRDWAGCPRKVKYKYIDKLPEPESKALLKGSRIHDGAEAYLKADPKARLSVPEGFDHFEKEIKALRKRRAEAERQVAFDKDWQPTDWFSGDAWCRVKMDASEVRATTATVIDFKTGKIRYRGDELQDMPQLELYALAMLLLHPKVNAVEAEFWYLDQGEQHSVTFKRSEKDELLELWHGRVDPMLGDTRFRPSPAFQCRWCPFNAAKGGPCEEGRKNA